MEVTHASPPFSTQLGKFSLPVVHRGEEIGVNVSSSEGKTLQVSMPFATGLSKTRFVELIVLLI
ncbi:hypothetical protein [Niameybacter massiliensis]|uniref:hypothetical protein n=1 Tax=Niameybacter massiliensis TaxID=1658108 RepID=UPI0018E24F84|nr:hypothetical protein [Niameybacter massiliensis]